MKRRWASLLMIAGIVVLAQSPADVDITAEPHHHLALKNKYVRVFKVEVPPQQSTLMHRHQYDYAYVTLGAVELANDVKGKPPATLKLQDGETRFSPGNFAHAVRDLSNTPFRNVTIEFLQGSKATASASAKPAEDRGLQILNGGTEDILFVKDKVRASDVQLNAGGILPNIKGATAELAVAVTEATLRAASARHEEQIHLLPGDIRWLPAAPRLVNAGKQSARFICFEFH